MLVQTLQLPLGRRLFLLSLLLFPFFATAQDAWKLEKNTKGVKVYTRFVDGWGIKEFKGITRAPGTLADFEKIIRNGPDRATWMHNTYNTKDIKTISATELYSYSVVDAPWPVSDRDNVTRMIFKSSPKELLVELYGMPKEHPLQSGCIRIERMQGYWKATDMGDGTIEITQQAIADAGGSIPDWLANSSVIDSPYNTLCNLKAKLEGTAAANKFLGK